MSTPQVIFDYLSTHTCASADDLAQVLAKTRANIQHHLKQMENDGRIIPVGQPSKTNEPGRPRKYYSLAQTQRPSNLVQLADILLQAIKTASPDSPRKNSMLIDLAQGILKLPGEPSLATNRLNRLVRELSNRGYQARWEARANGPTIVLRNCPYAVLLPSHPELCQMDALILEKHLGSLVVQKKKMQIPLVPVCEFIISEITNPK